MKLPGTPFMYAIFMFVFGHTNTGVHLGLLFINAGTMYFLFQAFKKIFNPILGLSTAIIYGFMALNNVFIGFAAHATHFICFFSSVALLFLASFMESGKIWKIILSGLFFGMAFLMKQQAIFLILFGVIFLFMYLNTEKKRNLAGIIKKIFAFGLGVITPYCIVVLIVIVSGEFHTFLLWTVEYASQYEKVKATHDVTVMEIIGAYFKSTFIPAWDSLYYIWIIASGGVLTLSWSPYSRLQKLFVLLYLISSTCMVSAGFYFRQHYYIVILPVLGLLSGIFLEFVIKQGQKRIGILKSPNVIFIFLSLLISFNIYTNRKYYFSYTPLMVCNSSYWGNPFDIAQEISKYIKDNTNDSDKIAVLGSEPEIYFYANRIAATGYLYTYPLVENQPYNEIMQEQMIGEIEKNKPVIVIFSDVLFSWMAEDGTPQAIFQWWENYKTGYTIVGIADFFQHGGWKFYGNDNMSSRVSGADGTLIIYRRNPENK